MGRSVRTEQFFDKHGRARESAVSRRLIKGWLGKRIGILRQLSNTQGKLLGLYAELSAAVSQVRPALSVNPVLFNAASNQPLHTDSILVLCEHGMSGAATPILRQTIEGLLIAKASTLDPSLIERWAMPEGKRTSKTSIRVRGDVLKAFRPRKGNLKLERLWTELNESTHYTPFAAQEPRVIYTPRSRKEEEHLFAQYHAMLGNTHHVIDRLFLTLKMHEHLLSLLRNEGADLLLDGPRASRHRWVSRHKRREVELLDRIKRQSADYCKANPVRLNRELLGLAFEYRVRWYPS